MRKNKERIDLDDRIWGINGTVDPDDYEIPATGVSGDQDLVYIKYQPAWKSKKALRKLARKFVSFIPGIGDEDWRRIPEPIPAKQVKKVYTPTVSGKDEDQDLGGQPDRKLVLKQDKNSNAAYEAEIGKRETNQINRLEAEKNRSDANSLIEQAEATEAKSNDESEDKKPNQYYRPEHEIDEDRY